MKCTKFARGRSIALAAGILLFQGSVAHASLVSSVSDNADGSYTYNYAIDNSAGSFSVGFWTIDLPVIPDWDQRDTLAGGDVSVPNNDWIADAGIPISGVAAQDFIALPGADVLPGSTLVGFSFTSDFAPGPVDYYEFDVNTGASLTGTTLGPTSRTAIPEPSTWLMGCGALALVAFRPLKRKVAEQFRRRAASAASPPE